MLNALNFKAGDHKMNGHELSPYDSLNVYSE